MIRGEFISDLSRNFYDLSVKPTILGGLEKCFSIVKSLRASIYLLFVSALYIHMYIN